MIHVFANLGIRVEICDELSCGKGNLTDGLTDRRTDTGNDISPSAWKPMGKKIGQFAMRKTRENCLGQLNKYVYFTR